MQHTRMYNGNDSSVTEALASYYLFPRRRSRWRLAKLLAAQRWTTSGFAATCTSMKCSAHAAEPEKRE